ncbi:MAG: sortase [Caldilineales bacterium]|nr:sortase [Caldilineales bacterium]
MQPFRNTHTTDKNKVQHSVASSDLKQIGAIYPGLLTSFRDKLLPALILTLAAIAGLLAQDNIAAAKDAANSGDNANVVAPTRLVIPSINLDSVIEPVDWTSTGGSSAWDVADYAVSWHNASAMPGQSGNMVFSGHHNIKGKVFRNLKNVEVGDIVTVYAGNQRFDYIVTKRMILRELFQSQEKRLANARWINPFSDERVTLVTCYPNWTNTHRLVLVAKPLSDVNQRKAHVLER